ncbi:MAG TPA: terminase family protein, partial [candidate division Zixibacteria bacterium]|nr:terminase family protein [candidate division Zixibacteria bacterium]
LLRESELLHPFILTLTRSPYPRLVLSNGAVIEARSTQNRGEYLLGNDYDYFIFDEVAFESDPDYVVEEVVKMRLADREGVLDLVSTPNGRNWFYLRAREIIERKRPGYFQSGDTRDNRFVSGSAIQARIDSFSDRRVQQNIMGKFVDSGGEILKGEYVDRALENAKRSCQGCDATGYFISGWDLARKKTATVGVTVSVVDGRAHVVCLERFRMFDWNVVIEKIRQRQEAYPGELVVDATGLGDVVVEQLRDYRPTAVIFSRSTKAELLTNVELYHARDLLSYDRWELPDGPGRIWSLEDELRKAQWDDNSDCDALMALALALWPLRKRKTIAPLPRVGRV